MRTSILALTLLLTACTAGSDWPSLARRPGESAPLPEAAPATAPAASADVSSASALVVSGRLAEATRDFTAVERRWEQQNSATAAAVAAARGTAEGSVTATKAQLELSRFERVGAQIGDLRVRLDSIGGDLAVSAAAGRDAGGELRQLGALIGKVEALRTQHKAAADGYGAR